MTPRRSSRARASQAPPSAMSHSNSSSSTNSLGRPERNTRSNNKLSSPRRSSTQLSQSVDDADARSRHDLPHTRQRQRGREDDENGQPAPANAEYEEEEGDEEEITRCICGQQDYPGLPPTSRETIGRNSLKTGVKEEALQDPSAAASEILSEDAGSLFIQCDSCKVWQHGGCVGIMEEALCPDEYFCEKCRKDLHRLIVGANGQKFSQYLPVSGTPSPPPSSSSTTSRNARDKKSKDHGDPPKRRSTMNSREAAYDEEELVRRAIEESKEDTKSVIEETSSRRGGKRTRSDSEVTKQAAKRQRTGSPSSLSIVSKQTQAQSQPVSEDEKSRATVTGNKKTRGTVTRNQREKEAPAEVEKEAPTETIGRRKGRSERRKGDDSEPEEPSPTKNLVNGSVPPQLSPETPDIPPPPAQKPATRKSGRPPARRGRVGRNQYTRDRDAVNGNGTDHQTNSPRRGQSRDANDDSPTGGGSAANGANINGGESGKPSRPRYMNPNRTTMNDMRRRVAAILEFISRMQVEMAATGDQVTPPNGNGQRIPDSSLVAAVLQNAVVNGDVQTASGTESTETSQESGLPKEREFKDLSSLEMMDELTRGLLKWQQEYGKYGDK